MPENKKQHYVPRSYLKRFSFSSDRSINLHNLKSGRTVLDANLKNQCYKNYLYGKQPEYEKQLCIIEGIGITALQYIDRTGHPPAPGSEMLGNLLAFVHFQRHRTLAAGQEANDLADSLYKHAYIDIVEPDLAKQGFTRAQLENMRVGYERPELASISFAAHFLPVMCDLKVKVLRIDSTVEFITSDNPVVFYNPYALMSRRKDGCATGLASRGLQVYLPISPRMALAYYDKAVYKVGGLKQTSVPIGDSCVNSLNQLQMLSANENVYFSNPLMAQGIERVAKALKRKRDVEKTGVRKIELSTHSELVHWFRKDISVSLPLQFCKFRDKPPRIWDPRTEVRDFDLVEVCRRMKRISDLAMDDQPQPSV